MSVLTKNFVCECCVFVLPCICTNCSVCYECNCALFQELRCNEREKAPVCNDECRRIIAEREEVYTHSCSRTHTQCIANHYIMMM